MAFSDHPAINIEYQRLCIVEMLIQCGPLNLEQIQDMLDWTDETGDYDLPWWDDDTVMNRLRELIDKGIVQVNTGKLSPDFALIKNGVELVPDYRPSLVLSSMDPEDLKDMMRLLVLAILAQQQKSISSGLLFFSLRAECGQLGEIITMSHVNNVLEYCCRRGEVRRIRISLATSVWEIVDREGFYNPDKPLEDAV